MPHSNEDTALLNQTRNGDRAAFDVLYNRYAGRILAFAQRLTGGNRADAEDLVQETFVAAFQASGAFRGNSQLSTYLLSITLRRFRDKRRRVRPDLVPLAQTEVVAPGPSLESATVENLAFQAALDGLDIRLREAFLLVAVQGLTHKEAAAVLGAPVGTLKWRVAEAARRLRAQLSEDATIDTITPTIYEGQKNVSPI